MSLASARHRIACSVRRCGMVPALIVLTTIGVNRVVACVRMSRRCAADR